ncbi:MAG TPA: putative cytokinetic ring protein SteA [Microthrixaceae bacterium]|nr:putative cytokinetic ring protein SteA [Microthrixaceae bacterium]HMT24538.1 putative cytokinetic ring protein SteA [Microthrixaceae bacterium]HMT61603.1 putative cytokinetic ring protein SteA [Microthrixaceae bacterium]
MTAAFGRRSAASLRSQSGGSPERLIGPARTDSRTKDLVKRLRPGEVAIIDHRDLDRVAAEGLAAAGIAAVIDAAPCSSGRYPNEGPLILLDAGIAVVDEVGGWIMGAVEDGYAITIDGGDVYVDDTLVASGVRHTLESIEAIHERSRATLGAEFIRFVENTAGYFEHNRDLVSDDLETPDVGIDFTDRHALIVVRGHDYRDDLQLLRTSGYIGEQRPVLIGVDGGADALIELGMKPDVIIGDFDSVDESTLRCGAVLVVHAYPDGRAPGAERLEALGLDHLLFRASGTSEDIAMLLAFIRGASLIVAVGTHSSMVDFLDKGRSGMASTILTRMKVGPILVDAKGVSRLYQGGVRRFDLAILVVGALAAMIVITLVSEPLQLLLHSIWSSITG